MNGLGCAGLVLALMTFVLLVMAGSPSSDDDPDADQGWSELQP